MYNKKAALFTTLKQKKFIANWLIHFDLDSFQSSLFFSGHVEYYMLYNRMMLSGCVADGI